MKKDKERIYENVKTDKRINNKTHQKEKRRKKQKKQKKIMKKTNKNKQENHQNDVSISPNDVTTWISFHYLQFIITFPSHHPQSSLPKLAPHFQAQSPHNHTAHI